MCGLKFTFMDEENLKVIVTSFTDVWIEIRVEYVLEEIYGGHILHGCVD